MDHRLLAVCASFALAAFACGGETTSDADELGEDDVTGVQDLTALEKELALVKDTRDAHGHFKRPPSAVQAGGCYKRTKGSANGADYQFRRYTKGAAFFRKKGTAPATGDDRPLACIDLDTTGLIDNAPYTASIERFELDAMMRYGLGPERGSEGAAGSTYVNFNRGAIQTSNVVDLPTGAKDSLDTPIYEGRAFLAIIFQGKGVVDVSSTVSKLVFQYTWGSAKEADTFTLDTDPVGKYLDEAETSTVGGTERTVYHYEHLDVYELATKAAVGVIGVEKLIIAPKLAGDHVEERAIVTCSRPLDKHGDATGKFTCTGL